MPWGDSSAGHVWRTRPRLSVRVSTPGALTAVAGRRLGVRVWHGRGPSRHGSRYRPRGVPSNWERRGDGTARPERDAVVVQVA